jgi:ArsR family transcriptional regulator
LVSSRREGTTVLYTLSSPEVAEMMDAARAVLTNVISGQQSLLAELASEASS